METLPSLKYFEFDWEEKVLEQKSKAQNLQHFSSQPELSVVPSQLRADEDYKKKVFPKIYFQKM